MKAIVETYKDTNGLKFETQIINNVRGIEYDIDNTRFVVITIYTNWHFSVSLLKRLELLED